MWGSSSNVFICNRHCRLSDHRIQVFSHCCQSSRQSISGAVVNNLVEANRFVSKSSHTADKPRIVVNHRQNKSRARFHHRHRNGRLCKEKNEKKGKKDNVHFT